MRAEPTVVRAIDAHAGGAGVRLVVDGFPPLRGRSLTQRRAWIDSRPGLVAALVREPRGHPDLLAAVFTEAVAPQAVAGLLCLGTELTPHLSGAGLIAATTIALERGLLMSATPDAFSIETPAGLVAVRPRTTVDGGRCIVHEVAYRPPPAYVAQAGLPVVVDGRRLRADIVWASGWYVIVDREALGVPPERDWADAVRRSARRLLEVLEPQVRTWPAPPDAAATLDAVVLTGPPGRADADLRSVTVYADGTIDRSPSGGGTVAVLAILDAMGMLQEDDRGLQHEGPAGLTFQARVVERRRLGEHSAIVAEVTGAAFVTAEQTLVLDPRDPLVGGFEV